MNLKPLLIYLLITLQVLTPVKAAWALTLDDTDCIPATATSKSLPVTVQNNDLGRTGSELMETQSLRNLAASMITAGALKEINQYFKLPNKSGDLVTNAKKGAIKTAVSTVSNATLGGQDLGQAFKRGATQGIVDTIGNTLAHKIGEKADTGSLDKVEQHLLHAGLGSVTGALTSALTGTDIGEGALSGAIGGFVGHAVAEMLAEDAEVIRQRVLDKAARENQTLTDKQYQKAYMHEVQQRADWGKMVGAVAALVTGQDVAIAIATASNAIDHNFMSQQARFLKHHTPGMTQEEALKEIEALEEEIKRNPKLKADLIRLHKTLKQLHAYIGAHEDSQAQPLSLTGYPYQWVAESVESLNQLAEEHPDIARALSYTREGVIQGLRLAYYYKVAAAGAAIGGAVGAGFAGIGTLPGAVIGATGGVLSVYSLERARGEVIRYGTERAVEGIREHASQQGRSPQESLRFADGAETAFKSFVNGVGMFFAAKFISKGGSSTAPTVKPSSSVKGKEKSSVVAPPQEKAMPTSTFMGEAPSYRGQRLNTSFTPSSGIQKIALEAEPVSRSGLSTTITTKNTQKIGENKSLNNTSPLKGRNSEPSFLKPDIIHYDWYKEFNIPKDWNKVLSNKQEGIKYQSPKNSEYNEVRIMEARPDSDFAAQRVRCVKIMKDGHYFDKFGNQVKSNSAEAHIPLEDFTFDVSKLWQTMK